MMGIKEVVRLLLSGFYKKLGLILAPRLHQKL
jgi:hypothetical protein